MFVVTALAINTEFLFCRAWHTTCFRRPRFRSGEYRGVMLIICSDKLRPVVSTAAQFGLGYYQPALTISVKVAVLPIVTWPWGTSSE